MIEPGQRRKILGWCLFLFVLVGSVTAWFVLDTGFRTDNEALTFTLLNRFGMRI